jgi:hypothetical protein
MSRTAIVAALEALDAGDVAEATAILLGALEELDFARARKRRRYHCPYCPADYRWPGELERHLLLVCGRGRRAA